MRVSSLSANSNLYNQLSYKKQNSKATNYSQFEQKKKVSLYKHNVLYFPNISFKSNDIENINEGYLKYLNETKDSPIEVKNKLLTVLNDNGKRNDFLNEILSNPRNSKNIVNLLQKKLGGKEKFLEWYFAKDGYVKRFETFLKEKYKNTSLVEDLIKFQPNWGYWALERKYCDYINYTDDKDELLRDRRANFSFGEIPEPISNKKVFNDLIYNLKRLHYMAKREYIYAYPKYFEVEQLEGGDLSSKNIYKIEDEKNNIYIIKMDRFYPEDKLEHSEDNPYYSRLAKETKLLRGDSVYLNACMDYYLQLNGCKTNAKLIYYDFENNASVYEFVDGEEINEKEKLGLLEQIQANHLFSEINDLGIFLNDIGTSFNCYKDKNNNLRIIDVGHAEYIDLLKPGAKLLTIETSNLSGFSLKNALAGLNTSFIENLGQQETKTKNDFTENIVTKDNYDYETFIREKKYKKELLKNKLINAQNIYGKSSIQTIQIRFELLEFYKRNILARKLGYADNNIEILKGILHAMKREIKEIEGEILGNNFNILKTSYMDFINKQQEELCLQ